MTTPTLPPGVQVFERGWLSANNILFTGGEQTALIDSGYCTHAAQTVELVSSALQDRQLDVLANTHLHSDHCGGNAALQKHFPLLATLIPPGHAEQVAQWDEVALTYQPTGQTCPRFQFNDVLHPGKSIWLGGREWEVHAAKGHDPHSVIFFDPLSATLVSADALWENGFGVVFPEIEGEDAFDEVALTLDLIEKLAPRVIIPGHGRVFNYAPEVLTRARARLEAFVAHPEKHAQHAAKVLLKYKLLEVQRLSLNDFLGWATATPFFHLIHTKFFAQLELQNWLSRLTDDLVQVGVARYDGAFVVNA